VDGNEENAKERYVVQHTITLRGIDAATFNDNPKVVQSFRATVGALLVVDVTSVRHVRACAVGATDVDCPRGIDSDTSAPPTNGGGGGGGGGGGRVRRMSDTDECDIRYEILVDNKHTMEQVKDTIVGDKYQEQGSFATAFVSEMKKENVDATIANQITSAEPNAQATDTTVAGDGNNEGQSNTASESAGTASKSMTNNVGKEAPNTGGSSNSTEMIVIGVLAGLIGVGVVAFVVLYVQRHKVQQRPNPMHPMVIEMGTVAGPFDGMIPVATAAVDVSALSSSSDLNVPPVAFVFDAVQGGAQKSNVDFGAAQRRRFSLYYDDKHGK